MQNNFAYANQGDFAYKKRIMKTYSIPLKVFIANSFNTGTCIYFKLPKGKATYSVELDHDLGVKSGKIIGSLNGVKYLFPIDKSVSCSGQFLREAWNYWKKRGSVDFEKWFNG
ncbi:hypothetical protein [Tenacibaculum dicentrarchi]|uniref:hypothetical protein n=1 Tax=Tenacibaculum dicentrarchi TaxID=669041 RepID=UPI000C3E152C|nr:conserved hypothetical protein. Putative prophage protein [Tenacibaculum dicentrarchi]